MGRKRRIMLAGECYHTYARGNEKKEIFRDNDDRYKFVNLVGKAKKKYSFILYAFVLMPNHYHLLLETSAPNLPDIMKFINASYSTYFNWKHKRVGHLFQGRYGCQLVEKHPFLPELTRYIHLNPVKAKLCKKIGEYKWSSYHEYCGRKGFGLSEIGWMIKKYGPKKEEAIEKYKMFLSEKAGTEAIETGLLESFVMGGNEFAVRVAESCGKIQEITKFRRPAVMTDYNKVIAESARVFNVSMEEVTHKKGKHNYAKAAAIYIIWYNSAKTYGEIGSLFNNLEVSSVKRRVASVKRELQTNIYLRNKIESITCGLNALSGV